MKHMKLHELLDIECEIDDLMRLNRDLGIDAVMTAPWPVRPSRRRRKQLRLRPRAARRQDDF